MTLRLLVALLAMTRGRGEPVLDPEIELVVMLARLPRQRPRGLDGRDHAEGFLDAFECRRQRNTAYIRAGRRQALGGAFQRCDGLGLRLLPLVGAAEPDTKPAHVG